MDGLFIVVSFPHEGNQLDDIGVWGPYNLEDAKIVYKELESRISEYSEVGIQPLGKVDFEDWD